MKHLISFSITIFFSLLLSNPLRSNKANAGNGIRPDSNLQAVTTSPRTNKGTITCLIDGKLKTFSIQGFREITLDFYSKGPSDGILFANGDDKKEGFQFKIKKNGTTKINHTGTGDLHCIINYFNPQAVTYTGEDVTVAVTSYNQNHLTGTFSGKLANVYYNSGSVFPDVKGAKVAKNYPKNIQITDGKFDLQQ